MHLSIQKNKITSYVKKSGLPLRLKTQLFSVPFFLGFTYPSQAKIAGKNAFSLISFLKAMNLINARPPQLTSYLNVILKEALLVHS